MVAELVRSRSGAWRCRSNARRRSMNGLDDVPVPVPFSGHSRRSTIRRSGLCEARAAPKGRSALALSYFDADRTSQFVTVPRLCAAPTSLCVSSGAYWSPAWKPPNSGVWYWMRVRRALVEPRRRLLPTPICESTLLGETKLPLREPEHARPVAVLLVDRVHVAELHRAEAAAQAEERVAVGPRRRCPVSNSSDCSICQMRLQPVLPSFSLAAEAEIGVLRVDRRRGRSVGVGRRRCARCVVDQVETAVPGCVAPRAACIDDLRIELAVDLHGADRSLPNAICACAAGAANSGADGQGECILFIPSSLLCSSFVRWLEPSRFRYVRTRLLSTAERRVV